MEGRGGPAGPPLSFAAPDAPAAGSLGRQTLVIGVVSGLFYWWMWGALRPLPAIHDEAAYLLQARIFAAGHWTGPARPLPEFFDQFYVLVTPVLAARYPPGHSLLLALGALIGAPALVPLVLSAVTGALLFATAARLAGPRTAAIAWLMWLMAPINLVYRATYLSNVTTSATWMLGWWALLRWSQGGGRRWAVTLAVCAAWCIITRPLTGAVFVASLALPVWRIARRAVGWRDLTAAGAAGLLVVALLPIANRRTTGNWRELAWTTYSRQYMPYDRLGFGLDSTPPTRPINAELADYNRWAKHFRQEHVPAALPRIAAGRTARLATGMWGVWFVVWLPVAAIGALRMRQVTRVGLPAVALLLLGHLLYAYPTHWNVYYLETLPVLAGLSASGVEGLIHPPARVPGSLRRLARGLILTLLGLWFVWSVGVAVDSRARSIRIHRPFVALARALDGLSDQRAVVFVHYGRRHSALWSLVTNEPDLRSARVWLVHDRGAENARLIALASGRRPYLYDEASRSLRPLAIAPAP
jgi:hypothetical protein